MPSAPMGCTFDGQQGGLRQSPARAGAGTTPTGASERDRPGLVSRAVALPLVKWPGQRAQRRPRAAGRPSRRLAIARRVVRHLQQWVHAERVIDCQPHRLEVSARRELVAVARQPHVQREQPLTGQMPHLHLAEPLAEQRRLRVTPSSLPEHAPQVFDRVALRRSHH